MTRARALVSAVPSRVWTAIAGLVLLASLGVTLVLGAGLATWRGGVSRTPLSEGTRPPVTGTTPPGSAVVVVPTPASHRQHPAQPPTATTVAVAHVPGVATVPAPAATPPVPAVVPPAVPPTGPSGEPAAGPPVTSHPRVTGPGGTTAGHGKSHGESRVRGHARSHGHMAGKTHGHAASEQGDQGKHLGWSHDKHTD